MPALRTGSWKPVDDSKHSPRPTVSCNTNAVVNPPRFARFNDEFVSGTSLFGAKRHKKAYSRIHDVAVSAWEWRLMTTQCLLAGDISGHLTVCPALPAFADEDRYIFRLRDVPLNRTRFCTPTTCIVPVIGSRPPEETVAEEEGETSRSVPEPEELGLINSPVVIATGGGGGTVRLWDFSGVPERFLRLEYHGGSCEALAPLRRQEDAVLVGYDGGVVALWDRSRKRVARWGASFESAVSDVVVLDDETSSFVACSYDDSVQLFDVGRQKPTKTVMASDSALCLCVPQAEGSVSRPQEVVLFGARDGTFGVWDVRSSKETVCKYHPFGESVRESVSCICAVCPRKSAPIVVLGDTRGHLTLLDWRMMDSRFASTRLSPTLASPSVSDLVADADTDGSSVGVVYAACGWRIFAVDVASVATGSGSGSGTGRAKAKGTRKVFDVGARVTCLAGPVEVNSGALSPPHFQRVPSDSEHKDERESVLMSFWGGLEELRKALADSSDGRLAGKLLQRAERLAAAARIIEKDEGLPVETVMFAKMRGSARPMLELAAKSHPHVCLTWISDRIHLVVGDWRRGNARIYVLAPDSSDAEPKSIVFYDGYVIDGTPDGSGEEYDRKTGRSVIFKGDYRGGVRQGVGEEFFERFSTARAISFRGRYRNGLRDGPGKRFFRDGKVRYDGKFVNGLEEGEASEYRKGSGSLLYVGNFHQGKRNGNGVFYRESSGGLFRREKAVKWYEGEFQNGLKHGNGVEYFQDGKKAQFECVYSNDKKNGWGVEYDTRRRRVFEGRFVADVPCGCGTEYFPSSGLVRFRGMWSAGKRHGCGEEFTEKGIMIKKGRWKHGEVYMLDATSMELPTVKFGPPVRRQLVEKNLLGLGAFGRVYKVKIAGKHLALKLLAVPAALRDAMLRRLKDALRLSLSMVHPNVCKVQAWFSTPKSIGYTMELGNFGSIGDLISKKSKLLDSLLVRLRILLAVAQGLRYLHEIPVMHRDLKWANVLYDPECLAKITDIDQVREDETAWKSVALSSRVGTLSHCAPEVLASKSYDKSCDVFSYGIMAYCLLFSRANPYGNVVSCSVCRGEVNERTFVTHLVKCGLRPTLPKPIPIEIDPRIVQLTKRCWTGEPSRRPTFDEIAAVLEAVILKESSPVLQLRLRWSRARRLRAGGSDADVDSDEPYDHEDIVVVLRDLTVSGLCRSVIAASPGGSSSGAILHLYAVVPEIPEEPQEEEGEVGHETEIESQTEETLSLSRIRRILTDSDVQFLPHDSIVLVRLLSDASPDYSTTALAQTSAAEEEVLGLLGRGGIPAVVKAFKDLQSRLEDAEEGLQMARAQLKVRERDLQRGLAVRDEEIARLRQQLQSARIAQLGRTSPGGGGVSDQ